VTATPGGDTMGAVTRWAHRWATGDRRHLPHAFEYGPGGSPYCAVCGCAADGFYHRGLPAPAPAALPRRRPDMTVAADLDLRLPAGPCGFYVTVRRGTRTGYLLGPHPTYAAAAARIPAGRVLAERADPRAVFDGFGVTRVVMRPGAELPAGVLEHLAAAPPAQDRISAYRHDQPARGQEGPTPVTRRLPLTVIKSAVQPGTRWWVTNHYVTDPGHAAYGTTLRVVTAVTSGAFTMTLPGDETVSPQLRRWPRAGLVGMDDDGIIRIYADGRHQPEGDLFLTLAPAEAGTQPPSGLTADIIRFSGVTGPAGVAEVEEVMRGRADLDSLSVPELAELARAAAGTLQEGRARRVAELEAADCGGDLEGLDGCSNVSLCPSCYGEAGEELARLRSQTLRSQGLCRLGAGG
jgi:hypothetical protein